MVVIVIVIAGICIYGKRERELIWVDLEGRESLREKNRASDHVVPRGGYVAKDVTSEPGGADNAKEAENYDVVGDVDHSGSYTNIHPVINTTRSMGPEEETAGKKKRKRDRKEGDRRREGDRREEERREKKKTSEQMELNVSSTTTTSGHVDGDDPYELYENWSAP
ncbi:hypothetical protein V1264_002405 [Littorina saxatilis]